MADAELAAEVSHLRWRLDALERAVARMARIRPALAPADCAWLAELLPAIAEAAAGAVWALPDLTALALLPAHRALAEALAHTGGPGGLRALGKRLARCAGHVVDDYELLQVGACRDGALWSVRQCVFETRETRAGHGVPDALRLRSVQAHRTR